MRRGHLITLEGIDGAGKSSVARHLVAALEARGHRVACHAEPTDTWLGQAVRRALGEEISPWADAFLFLADHAQHVVEVKALLAAGTWVVCDRWSDSTLAYQGASLAEFVPDALERLRAMEAPIDLRPDLTLLFELDARTAISRVAARGQSEKFEHEAFLERVHANYARLAQDDGERFITIDASAPLVEVAAAAVAVVEAFAASQEA